VAESREEGGEGRKRKEKGKEKESVGHEALEK
jgi:hypothetical protein